MRARFAQTLRTVFDGAAAAAGLVLLSPLLAGIAVAIKLQDGGPVLYSQWRIGRGFKPFRLYKFRSMVPNADRIGRLLTASEDRRLTRVGRILRPYKLDELPQLINVVKGEMQLVGARPEVEHYVKMFPVEYGAVLRERPGITDPASVIFRREEELLGGADPERHYIERILPAKLKISLDYARRRHMGSDLVVILSTVVGASRLPSWITVGSHQDYGLEAQE